MKIRRILSSCIILILLLYSNTSGGFGVKIESCYIEELGEQVLCGTFEVMENRSVRKGARIRLNFIILQAWTENPAQDPVFIFSGGPGVGSAANVVGYARTYEKLRFERDIILLDQRGTGKSNPLRCFRQGDPDSAQTYLQDMYPRDYVENCRKELEQRANLKQYHSTIAAQDCNELIETMGYDRINIIGGSYGSYQAIVFMQMYPEKVRSAALQWIAIPYWTYPATIAPNTEAGLEHLFADCSADPDCSRDYPEFRTQLLRVKQRLLQGPATVDIINPWTGQWETVTFTHNNFIHGLRSMLYSAGKSRWIPAFIHWADQGFYLPIAEYTARYLRAINEDIMDGMYLCVTCTETIPRIDYVQSAAEAQGTFMGTYRLDQQINACDQWVQGNLPRDFHTLVQMNIPTLIISGEIDPVTPPRYGDELAGYLSHSLHVMIPQAGHEYGSVWDGCLDDVTAEFISQGHLEGIEASCAQENKRPDFVSWRDYTEDDNSSESAQVTAYPLSFRGMPRARLNQIEKEPNLFP